MNYEGGAANPLKRRTLRRKGRQVFSEKFVFIRVIRGLFLMISRMAPFDMGHAALGFGGGGEPAR